MPLDGSSSLPEVSSASHPGGRGYQEDFFLVEPVSSARGAGGLLLGVFDGHGGAGVAEAVRNAAARLFLEAYAQTHANAERSLEILFEKLAALTQGAESGSTASFVLIEPGRQRLHAAVLGDSPVALRDAEGRFIVGPDHNARTNPVERQAAETRGAIFRDGYLEDPAAPGLGVQMARALGDTALNLFLSREPEIFSAAVGPGSLVLVGSDGVLDGSGQSAADQLKRLLQIGQEAAAAAIIEDVLQHGAVDNITALLWRHPNLKR